jgi:hypothetical protein
MDSGNNGASALVGNENDIWNKVFAKKKMQVINKLGLK